MLDSEDLSNKIDDVLEDDNKEEEVLEDTKKEEVIEDTKKDDNKVNSNSSNKNESIDKEESNIGDKEYKNDNNVDSESKEEEIVKIVEVTDRKINLDKYNSDIIIRNSGEYTLFGTLRYSLYIDSKDKVILNLDGVSIKSKTDAAIANINNNKLEINVIKNTNNNLSDGIVESQYDGCLFSNGEIIINGEGNLNIYGNQIDGEGIATKNSPITINNGNIKINTVDDGINTGGSGGTITINNGSIFIQASGDGIDSNKDFVMNDGLLYVVGSSESANSSFDTDKGIIINGGIVVGLGNDMLEIPKESKQNVIAVELDKEIDFGTLVTLLDEDNNVVLSFEASDTFSNLIISSNKLEKGNYYLYKDGVNSGNIVNKIYYDGEYVLGNLVKVIVLDV